MKPADVQELVSQQIPFAQKLGLVLEDITPSPSGVQVRLPCGPTLGNHGGTVHPGAQFTAAETAALAAGLLFLNGLAVTCHSKGCELRFRRTAAGDLWASAQLPVGDPSEFSRRLVAEGKVDLPILVEVLDASKERVAEGTVTLALRRL